MPEDSAATLGKQNNPLFPTDPYFWPMESGKMNRSRCSGCVWRKRLVLVKAKE